MGGDNISQEERAEYRAKVQEILSKHKAQDLKALEDDDDDDEEQKTSNQSGAAAASKTQQKAPETHPQINPEQIKNMFDKITEIETNPDGKEAQEYYKKLAELERNSPNKKRRKPAPIIIKNMRGNRTLSTQNILMNDDGTPMSEEEIVHKRKFLDFAKVTFPEVNPVEMILPDFKRSGQVRL